MKNILFMVLSFSIFLLFSCSDKEENEPFIPVDEIISAKTFLIPNKDTKVVSTILNFKNIDAIDYLMVRKSGGNSYSVKIDRNELTADYVFNYVVQKTDPQNFRLILVAVYKDGNKSNDLSLNVDNRWGFFIRSVSRTAIRRSPRSTTPATAGRTCPDRRGRCGLHRGRRYRLHSTFWQAGKPLLPCCRSRSRRRYRFFS